MSDYNDYMRSYPYGKAYPRPNNIQIHYCIKCNRYVDPTFYTPSPLLGIVTKKVCQHDTVTRSLISILNAMSEAIKTKGEEK